MASKDYKNGKIYCIRNTIDNDIYVGSTCQPLSKRMARHRGYVNDKTQQHRMLYVKMVEHGVDNFYIELIEECPCDNLEQLRRREGHFIRNLGTLNKNIAGRTEQENHKEYYIEHKEHMDAENKIWREDHPELMVEYRHVWYKKNKDRLHTPINCECGSTYVSEYEPRHIKTKQHQDYLKQLDDPTYTVVTAGETCECGGRYTKKDKAKHIKTKLHQNHIKNIKTT